MPFKKLGSGRYEGPSGKTFSLPQVKLYYANDGFPGQKKAGGGPVKFTKGEGPKNARYAEGGEVLQKQASRFMKTPDVFREDRGEGATQDYKKSGKGGELSKTEGDSKSEKPIKPRT